jgi:hypothetical protein
MCRKYTNPVISDFRLAIVDWSLALVLGLTLFVAAGDFSKAKDQRPKTKSAIANRKSAMT